MSAQNIRDIIELIHSFYLCREHFLTPYYLVLEATSEGASAAAIQVARMELPGRGKIISPGVFRQCQLNS